MNEVEAVTFARVCDPGRGMFCAVTKQGQPITTAPPTKREPIQDRVKNPRGVRHPFKTEQDHMPVNERPRVLAARKRVS